MELSGYGNFSFLYNINRQLYTDLYNAERIARLDHRGCGKATRDVLENFINGVIQSKRLDKYIPSKLDLVYKIKKLNSISEMRAAGYLGPSQTFNDKPLLPQMERVKFIQENGAEATEDYLTYLRRLANSCSHTEVQPWNPQVNYKNIVLGLRGYHLLLQRYYSSRLPQKISGFNEDLMPIGKYIVEEAHVPADKDRSKCIKEYLAYEPDDDGDPIRYYLIREYDRNSSDTTFILRNQRCFNEASRDLIDYYSKGIPHLQELTSRLSEESSKYIICYGFHRKPQPLTNGILAEMDLDQRMELCRGLVNCLDQLHQLETPIFHRMLNHESVYVCKFKNRWVPYIVKFDYAKIVTTKQIGTVFMSAVESQNYLRRQGREKYLPPEWIQIVEGAVHADWAKVDVYSLGVLIADILSGEITNKQVDLEDLEDMDVMDIIVELLDMMLAESPKARCSMSDVKEIFGC